MDSLLSLYSDTYQYVVVVHFSPLNDSGVLPPPRSETVRIARRQVAKDSDLLSCSLCLEERVVQPLELTVGILVVVAHPAGQTNRTLH